MPNHPRPHPQPQTAPPQELDLPEDFAQLCAVAGMRSLAAVVIDAPNGAPLGALVIGKEAPNAFDDRWSSVWLATAATGLLQHIRPPQVALAAQMLRTIEEAPDHVSAIAALLQVRAGGRSAGRAGGRRFCVSYIQHALHPPVPAALLCKPTATHP